MRALDIHRNGLVLCVAGTDNASLLNVHLNLSVEEAKRGALRIAGMNDLEGDRSSHTYWFEDEIMAPGEKLLIRFVESDSVTPPASEIATDSVEYIAEQELYEEEVSNGLFNSRAIAREWPEGRLSFSATNVPEIVASFESEREFMILSLSWNRWQPDTCRYYLSSFSQAEAIARTGGRVWAEGKLQLDEECHVSIALGT